MISFVEHEQVFGIRLLRELSQQIFLALSCVRITKFLDNMYFCNCPGIWSWDKISGGVGGWRVGEEKMVWGGGREGEMARGLVGEAEVGAGEKIIFFKKKDFCQTLLQKKKLIKFFLLSNFFEKSKKKNCN